MEMDALQSEAHQSSMLQNTSLALATKTTNVKNPFSQSLNSCIT